MVREVGSVVVAYKYLVSHKVGSVCSERYVSDHRCCAHGGPFPSIIHLSRSPIGALVSIRPLCPPVPLHSFLRVRPSLSPPVKFYRSNVVALPP